MVLFHKMPCVWENWKSGPVTAQTRPRRPQWQSCGAARFHLVGELLYASFKPAPRLPRNSTPLAVSIKPDAAWLSVGPT